MWVQDTMQFGKFTVNAGFRYDLQEGQNEAYEVPGNPAFPWLLPPVGYEGSDAGFDWSTFAPRIGATYALGEERKTLLRGSYSQFAEQLSSGNVNHINPLGYAYATFYYSDLNGNLLYDDGALAGRPGLCADGRGCLRAPRASIRTIRPRRSPPTSRMAAWTLRSPRSSSSVSSTRSCPSSWWVSTTPTV